MAVGKLVNNTHHAVTITKLGDQRYVLDINKRYPIKYEQYVGKYFEIVSTYIDA